MTNSVKRILVTGSEGFIGSHLVERLLSKNYKVRAMVLYNSFSNFGWLEEIKKKNKKNLEIIFGDVSSYDSIKEISKSCEKIFHLAALVSIPYSYKTPESFLKNNVIGTLNVLKAAKNNGVKKTIITSTSEVYGTAEQTPITESHKLNAQSPYSASKISADKFAESFAKSYDLPVIVARPFNNYGPRQSARAIIPSIIIQLLKNRVIKLGNLQTFRDFTYVVDTCDALIKLSNSKFKNAEVFNICNSKKIKINDLAILIAKILNKKLLISVDNIRVRPNKSEVNLLLGSNKKILKFVGWKPIIDLNEGLKKTISWFCNEKNIKFYKEDMYNI